MKKFRVEMTATKVVEVTLNESDLERGESFEDAAAELAMDGAFHNSFPDMVGTVSDWDVTVEFVTERKLDAVSP